MRRRFPVLALVFASAVSVVADSACGWPGPATWGLSDCWCWNLFLAWLPLVFALWARAIACSAARSGTAGRRLARAGLWLLFPAQRAAYIHRLDSPEHPVPRPLLGGLELDISLAAMTGFLLGFVSLCPDADGGGGAAGLGHKLVFRRGGGAGDGVWDLSGALFAVEQLGRGDASGGIFGIDRATGGASAGEFVLRDFLGAVRDVHVSGLFDVIRADALASATDAERRSLLNFK